MREEGSGLGIPFDAVLKGKKKERERNVTPVAKKKF